MADTAIIKAVSEWLAGILRENLCPRIIAQEDQIGLISPMEKENGYQVGVCLYDVGEEKDVSQLPLLEARRAKRQRPPNSYSLYYMVFLASAQESGLSEADRYGVVGSILQAANDYGMVSPNLLQPWLEMKEPSIILSQQQIGFEEKSRIFGVMGGSWRLSLFYKAAPVFLSNDTKVLTPRVEEFDLHVKSAEERSRGDG